MNKFLCFLVIAMMTASLSVNAQCTLSEVISAQQSYEEYVVSGVFSRDGEPEVIKLTHTVVKANNPSEALERYLSLSQAKFPGYVLKTSLVTPRGVLLTYEPCDFDI